MPNATASRKDQHLLLAERPDVQHLGGTGLDDLRLRHHALPERNLRDVGLETQLLGAALGAPLLASAMTGGTREAAKVNQALAEATAEHGIGLALGSGRVLLDDPGAAWTFFDASHSPRPPLLIANIGAGELRGPTGVDSAQRIVDMVGADALFVHLNPLQEALQPEGAPEFSGVAEAIHETVARLAPIPVAAKEVGFGLDDDDLVLLRDAGVAALDVAGAGGTNWATIEALRADSLDLATPFRSWGTPTAEAVATARRIVPSLPVIASGGLRDGVDVAKCLALGATAAGFARPLLLAARAGEASRWLALVLRQMRIAVWLAGARHSADLGPDMLRPVAPEVLP